LEDELLGFIGVAMILHFLLAKANSYELGAASLANI
jgi:hypothetical protein